MNSKPNKTTVETKSESTAQNRPLDEVAPLFANIWAKAGNAAVNTPTDWIAPANAMQHSAVDQMAGVAPTLGTNAPSLRDIAAKVANGFFLDPNNDPTFAAASRAAIQPITTELTEKVLPQIVDASIRNGGVGGGPAAYGGARQDIQENQVVDAWSRAAGDITAKMAAQSRETGMKLIPYAPQLDTGATTAALQPSQTLGAAGTQKQAYAQQELDDETKAWLAALQGGQAGANILTTGGFGNKTASSNSTQINTTPAPDLTTQWLQGITGGAGMIASLATGMPMLPGIGSIFGTGAPTSATFGGVPGQPGMGYYGGVPFPIF